MSNSVNLYWRRWRLAGAERGSRVVQVDPNVHCCRVRATKHASRSPFRVLENIHGLAEIVERGVGVLVECQGVIPLHHEREIMIFAKNAPRHGYRLAQQRLGFFEAP